MNIKLLTSTILVSVAMLCGNSAWAADLAAEEAAIVTEEEGEAEATTATQDSVAQAAEAEAGAVTPSPTINVEINSNPILDHATQNDLGITATSPVTVIDDKGTTIETVQRFAETETGTVAPPDNRSTRDRITDGTTTLVTGAATILPYHPFLAPFTIVYAATTGAVNAYHKSPRPTIANVSRGAVTGVVNKVTEDFQMVYNATPSLDQVKYAGGVTIETIHEAGSAAYGYVPSADQVKQAAGTAYGYVPSADQVKQAAGTAYGYVPSADQVKQAAGTAYGYVPSADQVKEAGSTAYGYVPSADQVKGAASTAYGYVPSVDQVHQGVGYAYNAIPTAGQVGQAAGKAAGKAYDAIPSAADVKAGAQAAYAKMPSAQEAKAGAQAAGSRAYNYLSSYFTTSTPTYTGSTHDNVIASSAALNN